MIITSLIWQQSIAFLIILALWGLVGARSTTDAWLRLIPAWLLSQLLTTKFSYDRDIVYV